jgi:cardiolipin synthase
MTLANRLTIGRMCLVPALVILVTYGYYGWSLCVFLIAGVTDGLDGMAARLMKERTRLGAMLDPLADKLLVTASMIMLSIPNPELTVRIPAWITILAISRDLGILITVLLVHLTVGRKTFFPTILGKATTLVQLSTILWVFWCNYQEKTNAFTEVLFGLTAAFTLASGLHYIYHARKFFAGAEEEATPEKGEGLRWS